jgi:hypothetical protein
MPLVRHKRLTGLTPPNNELLKLRKDDGAMCKHMAGITFCWVAIALSVGAAAQTGTVPLDSGTAPTGLTNSNITLSSGNVGIGTTSPQTALDVNGGIFIRGYSTTDTQGTNVGQWTELGQCTVTIQYQGCNTILQLIGGISNGASNGDSSAYINWRVKQQATFGSAPLVGVDVGNITGGYLQPAEFQAVVTTENSSETVVQLWAQIAEDYEDYTFTPTIVELPSGSGQLIFYANQGFSASLPSSTVAPIVGTPISNVAGTAAFPSITFVGNTNTGLYQASANAIGISTAGASRALFDASGNFFVGNSSQFQVGSAGAVTAPSITLSGTASAATFSGSGSGLTGIPYSAITGAPAAGVTSVFGRSGTVSAASGDYSVGQITGAAPLASPVFSGNVGIGTANPGEALNVHGNEGTPAVGSSNSGLAWFSESAGNNGINLGFYYVAGQPPYGWMQSQFVGSAAYYPLSINPMGGNVGIGTTSPGGDLTGALTPPAGTSVLDVQGDIELAQTKGGSIIFQDGTTQNTAYTGVICGGDYAESVDVAGNRKSYEPGDVLVIGAESGSDVVKSSEPYSTLVVGVYSTKPGVVGRRQTSDAKTSTTEVPMAMVGIVPTKVSTENGPINRGDLLVTSSTPGYAMKGTDRSLLTGAVIGKALGSLDSGTGVIEVVVTLQ